ncbi:hypothetical protein ACHWQZ_G007028 [Mnemiopsis leidyi]
MEIEYPSHQDELSPLLPFNNGSNGGAGSSAALERKRSIVGTRGSLLPSRTRGALTKQGSTFIGLMQNISERRRSVSFANAGMTALSSSKMQGKLSMRRYKDDEEFRILDEEDEWMQVGRLFLRNLKVVEKSHTT